jgi:protein gp37
MNDLVGNCGSEGTTFSRVKRTWAQRNLVTQTHERQRASLSAVFQAGLINKRCVFHRIGDLRTVRPCAVRATISARPLVISQFGLIGG